MHACVAEHLLVGRIADQVEGLHVFRGGEGVGPFEAAHLAEPQRAQCCRHASHHGQGNTSRDRYGVHATCVCVAREV